MHNVSYWNNKKVLQIMLLIGNGVNDIEYVQAKKVKSTLRACVKHWIKWTLLH